LQFPHSALTRAAENLEVRLVAVLLAAVSLHMHPIAPGWAIAVNDHGDILGSTFVIRSGRRHTLNGGTPVAMDARGDVLGYDGRSSILWRADGSRVPLGLGMPAGINDNGWAIGDGFVWHAGRRTAIDGQPKAINDRDEVVGVRNGRAFLWRNGFTTDLPSFHGELTEATAISSRGLIVGDARPNDAADPDHALVWQNGTVRSLGTFGGARSVYVAAVNARNEVLVNTEFPDHHAWLWANGKARDLGTLGHPWWNVAHDLNDNGAVVGNVQRAPHGPNVPYVWHDGRFTVLPGRPGWTHAAAINDAGVVVGGGYRGREPVAVVWR
jgi:probable HAF family extracellular repeat protein